MEKSLNQLSNQIFELSVKLEKAKSVLEMLGGNSYLDANNLTEIQRNMLAINHSINSNLFSVVNDYLFDALNDVSKLTDQVKEIGG